MLCIVAVRATPMLDGVVESGIRFLCHFGGAGGRDEFGQGVYGAVGQAGQHVGQVSADGHTEFAADLHDREDGGAREGCQEKNMTMICYSNFPGDDDERLMMLQFDAYSEALWTIVNAARERFLDAEKVLRISPTMSPQVRALKSIDHRTVQDMHDLIAAWYRFQRRTERMFPLLGDDLRRDWIQFVTTEARQLCSSAYFVTGVLDACVYSNTDCGYAGEKLAKRVQEERYSEMFRYSLPHPQSEAEP